MLKKSKNTILFIVLFVFACVISLGYYLFNKKPSNIETSAGIKATSDQVYSSYINDSIQAHKNFDNKVLIISGIISAVKVNMQQQQVILLKTFAEGSNINCTMDKPVPGIKPGDSIVIKGLCSGLGGGDADLGILGDVYITRATSITR
jgi:hypothetical protein